MDDYKITNALQILSKKVRRAIEQNDQKEIEFLLNTEHDNLTNKRAEEEIFVGIYNAFIFFNNGEELLKYLIFNYCIDEHNSINIMDFKDENVQNMFEIRKLKNELNSSLNASEYNKKKTKV